MDEPIKLVVNRPTLAERIEEARLYIRDILESYQEDDPVDLENPQDVFPDVLYTLEEFKEIVGGINMTKEFQLILYELAAQVYLDGNLYEWFCNIIDEDTDTNREFFQSIVRYMKSNGRA
jgi:hypothetical protein